MTDVPEGAGAATTVSLGLVAPRALSQPQSSEWLERHNERQLGHQRQQVETAKLLSTFAAGISAALVATALQVGPARVLDVAATALLSATVLATLAVIALDRLREPDATDVLEKAIHLGWGDGERVAHLRLLLDTVVTFNVDIVQRVRWAAMAAVLVAVAAGVVASMSLLLSDTVG